MRAKLNVGPDDEVALPKRDADTLGVTEGEDVELVTVKGGFTLVSPSGEEGAWFAGSLKALPFAELAQLLAGTLRSGVLVLVFGRQRDPRAPTPEGVRRKTITFKEGQIVFASSSDPADRLGPVLWRAGILSLNDLERPRKMVGAGRPLGQVLVDEGLLTPADLYQGVIRQVREIVLSCFHEREGDFFFREDLRDERNQVKMPERTRDILLAGMKRTDEIEHILLNEVQDAGAPLTRRGEAGPELDFRAARLLAFADGRPLRAAIAGAQLGAYDGLRAAAELVRADLVSLPARVPMVELDPITTPADEDDTTAGIAFDRYQRIFQRLFVSLRQATPDACDRLNGYFDRLPEEEQALFDGVRFDVEGELDAARVLVNVDITGGYQGAAVRARALEALDAFLSFALFEVKNVLPHESAEVLLHDIKRMKAEI
jgi:hypothetical protein